MAFLIIRDIIPFFKKIGRWERLIEHPLMPSDFPSLDIAQRKSDGH